MYFAFFYLEAANEMTKAVKESARSAKDKCKEVFELQYNRTGKYWEEVWEEINVCTHMNEDNWLKRMTPVLKNHLLGLIVLAFTLQFVGSIKLLVKGE